MARRPRVKYGQYYRTRSSPTGPVCKAYTGPPRDGDWITNLAKGTYVGPVELWLDAPMYATICVRGYWINVWKAKRLGGLMSTHRLYDGDTFADAVPDDEVQGWIDRGWRSPMFLNKNPRMHRGLERHRRWLPQH